MDNACRQVLTVSFSHNCFLLTDHKFNEEQEMAVKSASSEFRWEINWLTMECISTHCKTQTLELFQKHNLNFGHFKITGFSLQSCNVPMDQINKDWCKVQAHP